MPFTEMSDQQSDAPFPLERFSVRVKKTRKIKKLQSRTDSIGSVKALEDIAASAGGFRAPSVFFRTIPADTGTAFVVVTSLTPQRERLLLDILARHTELVVQVASDGLRVEPHKIYLLAPNFGLTIVGGRFRLRKREAGRHKREPTAVFFGALAQDCGEYATGNVVWPSGGKRGNNGEGLPQNEIESRHARQRLRSAFKEYETILEKLKPAKVEQVSPNEDICSRVEKLESTKTELLSLNKQLRTDNQELRARIKELELANLLADANVATVFFDRNLDIRSVSPAASRLFNINATDKRRPLGDLAKKFDYPELQADIETVLASGTPIERKARGLVADVPYFLARLSPCRNSSQTIDGVAVTFVDVTSLAKSEERQRWLVAELNHRVKNILTVVMVIGRQTLAHAASPEDFSKRFFARLHAFARAHELLSRENWAEVGLRQVALQALEPFFVSDGDRIAVSGPETMLSPQLALSFGLILDELATNAVKYGALSNAFGSVAVSWSVSTDETDNDPVLRLTWQESGGPAAKPPKRQGFGMKIMKQEVEHSHFGVAKFAFAEDGLSTSFEIPRNPRKGAPQWQGR